MYVYILCIFYKGGKKMNFQWTWIIGLLFAIVIAVFSVMNVDSVPVNYVFGTAEWPLVLVILGAALLGAAVSGFMALFRAFKTKHEMKEIKKELKAKEALIQAQQDEIQQLKKKKGKVKEPDLLQNDGEIVEVIPPEQKL